LEKLVLQEAAVQQALEAMAQTLLERPGDGPWAVIGIRRGGDHLAKRLAGILEARLGTRPPVGAVDITLYRDDGFGPHDFPQVGVTHIDFDTAAYTIVLVDDVLYTGRTVRAALDVILDYGRPRAVRLAVLVDRGWRELPIAADVVGLHLTTANDEHVQVRLKEAGAAADAVAVVKAQTRRKT
jgi:pyrimidine operon attenuation protein/uracil phosphoribosyltransferase